MPQELLSMDRRRFVSLSLAGASHLAWGTKSAPSACRTKEAQIVLGEQNLGPVPLDYAGLSYEAAQLYNPSYFSDTNTSLVTAFRKRSPQGVLRIGGNLSDVTRWEGPNGDFS